MTQTPAPCEVLVIGGGPAGSSIATRLAQSGRQVVLLEKDHHPRFHIGESLLPASMDLLRDLGVYDEVAAIGMQKWGIEFVSPTHSHRILMEFSEGWDKRLDQAFQVRRADFDEILIRNAQRKGVDVHEGCRARSVEFLPEGAGVRVSAVTDAGVERTWQARFLVDASGRDTFLANRFKTKRKNPDHNSSALYAHYEGVQRLDGRREGNISVFWFEHGWIWQIPLSDGVTSLGAVCWPYYLKSRKTSLEQFFSDTLGSCPPLAERLKDARRVSDVFATGNYSYTTERSHGENFLAVGDAYTFVDPVFSSGVHLAMVGGFAGARVVDACLTDPAAARREMARFDKLMRHGPRQFSWFIYRMTQPAMRELFMHPRNVLRIKEAILGLLAGDIYGSTPIWPSLYAFRVVYYLSLAFKPRQALRALRQRRVNISDASASSV